MSDYCKECGAIAGFGQPLPHKINCSQSLETQFKKWMEETFSVSPQDHQTAAIKTKDGHTVILYISEPLTVDERCVIEELTKAEIKLMCKLFGMKEVEMPCE